MRRPYGCPDDPLSKSHPKLWDWLTSRQTPGGKSKECPKITLELTDVGWRCTVKDFTLSTQLQVSYRHAFELFDALEAVMVPNSPGWTRMKAGDAWKAFKSREASDLAKEKDPIYDSAKGGGDLKKREK